MANRQSAQRRSGVLDSVGDWMEARNAELYRLRTDAEAAGRRAWERATRTGENLAAMRPSDVLALGARVLQQGRASSYPSGGPTSVTPRRPTPATSVVARASGARAPTSLDRSSTAKKLAGDAARLVGTPIGVARGGVHAVEGLVDGAVFVGRLANPWDRQMSAPGQSAAEQLYRAGGDVASYVKKSVAEPESFMRDVGSQLHRANVALNPTASPVADTLAGEIRRQFDIGKNQGEAAFDVGSLAVGGPLPKSLKALGAASEAGKVEKYIAQGFSPAGAKYLAEPYPKTGMGHHSGVKRADKLPDVLGGGPYPAWLVESPFNVVRPKVIPRGEFYELHYGLDDDFYGTALGKAGGRARWSGRDLGLERFGDARRIWYGTPEPTKRVAGRSAVAGGLIYDEDEGW